MTLRIVDLLALLALGCVGITGLARAVALTARGVWVLPIDRERSVPEGLADLAFLLGLLAWVYEAVATVIAPQWRLDPTRPSAGSLTPCSGSLAP